MAKVLRIVPIADQLVRIELNHTVEEFQRAGLFKPGSLHLRNEDRETEFVVLLGKVAEIGRVGVRLPLGAENKFTVKTNFGSEEETMATLASIQTNLTKIETQVEKALAEFAETKKEIKEV